MPSETDVQAAIIKDLKERSYFSLRDNSAKTKIRAELAAKYKVDAVWIKDVVTNGYGKDGRKIGNDKVLEILGSTGANVSVEKLNEDPAEGYARFKDPETSVYFVSSAPGQVGIGMMKAMEAMKSANTSGLVIVNNGNDGPLPDAEFADIKTKLSKAGIHAAGVHSSGVSHKADTFKALAAPQSPNGDLSTLVDSFAAALSGAGVFSTKVTVQKIAASLLAKRFLILTGLAGSGKTKLAQAFARWITPKDTFADPFYPGAVLESAKKVYSITRVDTLGLECRSDEDTKVLLPRAIIEQWANYIEKHSLPETIGAQELREKIKAEGGEYSDYLQNFQSHYKAAAFALLKARKSASLSKCYELVPVGADWTGSENVLGYPNGLEAKSYVTKPALDLILRARRAPTIPHFLILDEMNLSHVERYFADLLSMIESQEAITLYCDKKGADGKPENTRGVDPVIGLPENLFIIGTVNVDETTYMFSPKVLDRANVIEFHVTDAEMAGFLEKPGKPDLELLSGGGAALGPAFVAGACNRNIAVPNEINDRFIAEMKLFFALQREHGVEYGFRVAHEASRFLYFYKQLGGGKIWSEAADGGKGAWIANEDARDWFDTAFDSLIIQKFLPKLHGSKAKLGPLLEKINTACIQPHDVSARDEKTLIAKLVKPTRTIPGDSRYPVSAEKVSRMWRQLNENGFTSFPEN